MSVCAVFEILIIKSTIISGISFIQKLFMVRRCVFWPSSDNSVKIHYPVKFLNLLYQFHRIMFLLLKSDTQTTDQLRTTRKIAMCIGNDACFHFFTNPQSLALFVACESVWLNDSICTMYVP